MGYLDGTGLSYLLGKIKAAFVSKTDAVAANAMDIDSTPTANSDNLVKSGGVKSYVDGAIPDVTGKADKVSGGTTDNFAALDANGNLKDSGHKHSDYLTSHQDISGKADKDTDAVTGNFAAFDASGNPVDSGKKASDFLTEHQDISGKADKATTLGGYGITDAKIESGTITLGSNTITPLTSHQDITGKEDKSNKVTSFGSTPSNDKYPSEKLVKDSLDAKQPTIDASNKLDYSLIDNTPAIPTVPTISTNIQTDKASDVKTASPKAVYDEVHPATGSSQPAGGMLPNKVYNFGTIGDTTFALASPTDANIVNHYYWTFDTGSTAPTIGWPNGVSWSGGAAPTINASKHYEISVLNGIGCFMEV